MEREIIEYLKMNDVKYEENRILADLSKIRIGGQASLIVYPKDKNQLVCLLKFLGKAEKPHKIIGRMSNVLFSDDEYTKIIIKTDLINSFSIKNKTINIDCGCSLPWVAKMCANAGVSAFEELSGIPGSVGGALFGNAGAFGKQISDITAGIEFYSLDEDKVFIEKTNFFDFGYRDSLFKRINAMILSASFAVKVSSVDKIKEKMKRYRDVRVSTQPVEYPSLGSSFKRPGEYMFASKMIDECGLKGYRIGGAMISEKHAGFIVNYSGSTAKDYINLMNLARDKVYERFGIYLEEEIEIIG